MNLVRQAQRSPYFVVESRLIMKPDGPVIRRLPFLDIPPNFIWFQLRNTLRLRKLLRGFDVIHSQHAAGTVCAVLKKTLKRPWIVTFHGSWSRSQMTMMTDALGLRDFFTYRIGFPVFHGVTHIELGNSRTCRSLVARHSQPS